MESVTVHTRSQEIYLTTGIYALSFTIPLLFSAPQLITGSVVNALLFIATTRMSKKAIVPVLLLPSVGALLHGVIFGPQTIFLVYFLPFIWTGNYMLTLLFSGLKTQPYWIRLIFASVGKYMLLVASAGLYYHLGIVPALFVSSMGIIQLTTAFIGGIIAYGCSRFID